MSTSRRGHLPSGKRPSQSLHSLSTSAAGPSKMSTTAHSRLYSVAGYPPLERNPSPPASSYFPSFADTEFGEPQPTPGATNHFAYSTTLRRHSVESVGFVPQMLSDIAPVAAADGLFQKVFRVVTGKRSRDDAVESNYVRVDERSTSPRTNREEKRDTPSARFAHCSVEVCPHVVSSF